ncbi:ABC transporter substrate-binding protein [Vineibacter terrae]|uniref:ABC transporter substrate-binding protein n=1 Tax=Vineibacter terrae TaxID=2586908 RepID=UPI002E3366DC|nr:ABC transporter substrate-binding protein [Vineibacter terrae]HEX2891536.1 ABC transporter substrate-binding protein [Vineibacter terrae]
MLLGKNTLAAVGLVLAASWAGGAVAQDKTYTIGCSLPLSGRLVGFGEPIKRGIDMAIEHYNERKTIAGARFELACNDSKGDAKETVSIGQKLADNAAVLAVISDFSSTTTMAAAETYSKAGLIQITPSASHPELTKMNKWMFRASETVPVYVEPMADFAVKDLGKKKVAVIQVQTDWGVSVGNTFIAYLKKIGGELTTHEIYNEGTTDFRGILNKLRRSPPDAIYIAMLEEEAANFMKQRKQLGMTGIAVVDSGVGLTQRSLKLADDAFEGMYSMSIFNPTRQTPEVQAFTKEFQAKYDKIPDVWSAYGYDAASLVMNAIGKAGPSPTRAAVRDALAATGRYSGANGPMSIDPATREVTRDEITKVQVKDGKVVFLPSKQ